FPSCGFDAGLTLHHGTSMPIRDFRRALGTGKSLSFAKHSTCQVETIDIDATASENTETGPSLTRSQ
ncbi:hypothetical protein QCD83_20855, partial [Pseudomonas savastanoi pv. phaseolicola]|uniref:hypothetical protein n=1 Tax=Pseudomonas savastanoi TaxID=29438 RepID=UPI002446715F